MPKAPDDVHNCQYTIVATPFTLSRTLPTYSYGLLSTNLEKESKLGGAQVLEHLLEKEYANLEETNFQNIYFTD